MSAGHDVLQLVHDPGPTDVQGDCENFPGVQRVHEEQVLSEESVDATLSYWKVRQTVFGLQLVAFIARKCVEESQPVHVVLLLHVAHPGRAVRQEVQSEALLL